MQSIRKKPLVIVGGYEMRHDKASANGSKQFWRCNERSDCKGRGRSDFGTTNIQMTQTHNHLTNPARHSVNSFKNVKFVNLNRFVNEKKV